MIDRSKRKIALVYTKFPIFSLFSFIFIEASPLLPVITRVMLRCTFVACHQHQMYTTFFHDWWKLGDSYEYLELYVKEIGCNFLIRVEWHFKGPWCKIRRGSFFSEFLFFSFFLLSFSVLPAYHLKMSKSEIFIYSLSPSRAAVSSLTVFSSARPI